MYVHNGKLVVVGCVLSLCVCYLAAAAAILCVPNLVVIVSAGDGPSPPEAARPLHHAHSHREEGQIFILIFLLL